MNWSLNEETILDRPPKNCNLTFVDNTETIKQQHFRAQLNPKNIYYFLELALLSIP